jgi:hypothetical protein
MAPINRRSFIGGLTAAALGAMALGCEPARPATLVWDATHWRTHDGAIILDIQPFGDRLLVFTRTSTYVLNLADIEWAERRCGHARVQLAELSECYDAESFDPTVKGLS